MKYVMSPPPTLRGLPEQQLRQLYSWLFQMNQQLNVAINSLDASNFTPETAKAVQEAAAGSGASEKLTGQYNSLRSLIVKTAESVRSELEVVRHELRANYVAVSDWGKYEESLRREMEATAYGVLQSFDYDARLEAADANIAEFESYRVTTAQYIKTGLLYYDENEVPRYGVAVGEKLSTVEVDGETLLTRTDLCATFTSDRLTFWQGGREVAYVSNSQLYINNVEILGWLHVGGWEIKHANGFSIKWIGG